MKSKNKLILNTFFLSVILMLISTFSIPQQIETKDGVCIVHNEKEGKWGKNLKVSLKLIRTIGDIDTEDENLAFIIPQDVVLDSAGNIYICDFMDNRIQKLSPEGNYIATIGREGQGPADLYHPYSMDLDLADNLYVLESMNERIQVFNSKGETQKIIKLNRYRQNTIRILKSGLFVLGGRLDMRWVMSKEKELPKLLELMDKEGNIKNAFGEMKDYQEPQINWWANWFDFEVDPEGNYCLCFNRQNRIEKYSPDGKLLWRADRVLNYGTEVLDNGYIKRSEEASLIQGPEMNEVSEGIAMDREGRIWVITLNRQLRPEEKSQGVSIAGATKKISTAVSKQMDIYKLEIFDPEGIFLGEIQLDHIAHGIRIQNNYLFIWDMQNTKYYQYEIIEK